MGGRGRKRSMRRGGSRWEALGVGLAVSAIVLAMAVRAAMLAGADTGVHLQPYQRLDSTLSPSQRTVFQALVASADEVAGLWRSAGRWPDVPRLEAEELPPFAAALLPPALRTCSWTAHDQGSWSDYLGRCTLDQKPQAFLLRIVDLRSSVHPHPHPNYDPGLKVASQVWLYLGQDVPYPVNSLLEADWLWIVNLADPSLKDRR
jgi:uncharacterized protein DUF6162